MKSSENRIDTAKSDNRCKTIAVLRDVTMWFDNYSVQALRNVSLEVRRGEVFGLLGPKGAGKSTLLAILAGRLSPKDGKVKVLGRSFLRRMRRSGIGYVPEKTTRNREPSLAQALVKNPELVILDEPFASLDVRACHDMKDLIRSLARRGVTVVFSSDSLSAAKDICDRLAVLFDGRIQAIGTLEELIALPEAACFIAPLLPKATADRLLKIIRDDVRKENLEQNLPTDRSESGAEQILTSLTNATEPMPPSPSAGNAVDGVNHERLAQLTKPAK